MHLESTGDAKNPVKCFLACKTYQDKRIKIIQIFDKSSKMEKFHINYFNDEAKNFDLKIIHQNEKIISILSNGLENFIVEYNAITDSAVQRSMYQLNDLHIHGIIKASTIEEGFYIVASKPYDQTLTVLNSEVQEFQLHIKRNLMPDIVKI